MRCDRDIRGLKALAATLWLGVLGLIVLPAGIVLALDLPSPGGWQTEIRPVDQHLAIDGSVVVTSLGNGSTNLNTTFAPFGDINASGFRMRVTGSYSWYEFLASASPRTIGSGHTWEAGLQAGYQIALGRLNVIGLVGPTVAESESEGVNSARWGAKTDISVFALPSDLTMFYGSVSYSTIEDAVQLQSKLGVKLLGNAYIGPEATFSWRNTLPSFDNVAVMQIGGHISAMTLGPMQLGVSAGWAQQEGLGHGYYGGFNFYWSF